MNPSKASLKLGKYSIGVGDRFAHQGRAQLRAFQEALAKGVEAVPVWNKSNREHTIIGSTPAQTRAASEAAVRESGWKGPWHLDADHIGLKNVDGFLEACDFFTLDVAEEIGRPASEAEARAFADRHPEAVGRHEAPGLGNAIEVTRAGLEAAAKKYLPAVREAGRIYRRVEERKGAGRFITEVSMDETDRPQTPAEILVILAAVADEKIPVQTIAPKFSGRFNKGVDYVGDAAQFEREFRQDLSAIALAVKRYGLPENLKLSVHSGSDKFSIYPVIRRALRETGAGLHLKTAGTTWLEELIGLAEAGGEGLAMARKVYTEAWAARDAMIKPYASVVDIDPAKLPDPSVVKGWDSKRYVEALRHDRSCPGFNPHFRQLLHVAYGAAAKLGDEYLGLLAKCEETVSRNVARNLYERHLKPLFLGD
jgi:hypothetical protein